MIKKLFIIMKVKITMIIRYYIMKKRTIEKIIV